MVIVPSYISDAINKQINEFIGKNNIRATAEERDDMYSDLLLAYHEYGEIAVLTVNNE